MYESNYSHLANPQLESQLRKSLDQGLLCTNPVPVGHGVFTDSLPDSCFHPFIHLRSHLFIHSSI